MGGLSRLCPTLALAVLCACDPAVFVPIDAGGRPVGISIPERPDVADATDLAERVFVLRDVQIDGAGTLGWDIDHRCSLVPEPPATQWDVECAPTDGVQVIDLQECRDDSFGANIAGTFPALGSQLVADVSLVVSIGSHAHLLRLSGWSGERNDPRVRVDLARIAYGVPDGGTRGDPVLWDGNDTFYPIDEAFDLSDQPVIRDEDAFVADGRLVATLPDDSEILLHAGARSLLLRLTGAALTARLAAEGLSEVVLSGRWRVVDLLAELDRVGICASEALRTSVEIRIRGAADVRTMPRGGPGMTAPCESISLALGFSVQTGLWGDTREPASPRPEPCPP
jgi:hypothetical protein